MFRICSNKRASFVTDIVKDTVYIPCTQNDYWAPQCKVYDWANQADQYARDILGYKLDAYKSIIYVLPKGDGCGFGGLGSVGPCGQGSGGENTCRVWISGQIPNMISAYFHEIGHNLGLMHASYMNDQYGDLTDTMGYCCNVRCFSAPNSFKLKWSRPVTELKVPIRTRQEFKLLPSQYILVTDKTRAEMVFIQLRIAKNGLYDKDITTTAVNVYSVSTVSYSYSTRDATLWTPGHTWENMHSLKVTLLRIFPNFAIIRIEPRTMIPTQLRFERIPL